MTAEQYGDVMLYVGMVGIIVFTILYATRSKWWRYLEGWALLGRSAALSLVSAYVGAAVYFGEFWGRDAFRNIAYTLLAISSLFSVGVLLYRQRQKKAQARQLASDLADAEAREAQVPTPDLQVPQNRS